jgi:hypothetical protein
VADAGPAQPVRASGDAVLSPDESNGHIQLYVVPAGKRLVIEYVDARFRTGASATPSVLLQAGGDYSVALEEQGPDYFGGPLYVGGQTVKLYADAGSLVHAEVSRGPLGFGGTATVGIVGYLVDL